MASFGIDFGTTNSVVAMHGPSGIEVLPVDHPPADWGQLGLDRVMPTVFATGPEGGPRYGWMAKQSAGRVEAVKRLLAEEITVDVNGRSYDVEQLATDLLGHVRASVSDAGVTMERAVVTIPANSRGKARFRTKQCALRAGITVPAMINEPTAAAMAYCYRHPGDRRLLVVDWGGGTLDVTIIEAVDGTFIEQASKGIQMLGGIDFDKRFRAEILSEIPGVDTWNEGDRAAFWLELEKAKILLSSYEATTVPLPSGEVRSVSRNTFETAVSSLVERVSDPIERCLTDVGAAASDLDAVVLVGGTCRIPAVRRFINELLGVEAETTIDPMTAIAEGAAVASGILAGEIDADFVVSTEHALGTIASDPDTLSETFSVLIPRNHKLPADSQQTFFPAIEGQKVVNVRIIEGDPDQTLEHPDNVVLQNWVVSIPPGRSLDDSAFDIQYSYDVDGILHVAVIDNFTDERLLQDHVSYKLDVADPDGADDGQEQIRVQVVNTANDDSLLSDARSKVIPFVDEEEAEVLRSLVRQIETQGSEAAQAAVQLDIALKRYEHLL